MSALIFRDKLIPGKLPSDNIIDYEVGWTENAIDPSVSKGKHLSYVLA